MRKRRIKPIEASVPPYTPREVIEYYMSDGKTIPERFQNTDEARRQRILDNYTGNTGTEQSNIIRGFNDYGE